VSAGRSRRQPLASLRAEPAPMCFSGHVVCRDWRGHLTASNSRHSIVGTFRRSAGGIHRRHRVERHGRMPLDRM
jgi:hypothetical protein